MPPGASLAGLTLTVSTQLRLKCVAKIYRNRKELRKGQCLTLGRCKAPSRGEGQARPGGTAGRKICLLVPEASKQALSLAELRTGVPFLPRAFPSCTSIQFKEHADWSPHEKDYWPRYFFGRRSNENDGDRKKQQPRQIDFPAGRSF